MLATVIRRTVTRTGVAASLLLALIALGGQGGSTDPMEGRPMAPQSPAGMLAAHPQCWTGEAPPAMRGKIPGHVLWQHTDGRTVYSARLVSPALDSLFSDGTLPGRAVAFCA